MEAKDKLEQDETIYQAGKKAGLMEVVEWIEMVSPVSTLPEGNMKHFAISTEQWQAFKKSKGGE